MTIAWRLPEYTTLVECVREFGDVYVVAPAHPHSGQSSALTVGAPLRIRELPSKEEGVRYFTVNGTPVDCVKLDSTQSCLASPMFFSRALTTAPIPELR